MGTPHNEAKKGDFAKTVLMPGDPLRSKFIAETFLTDLKLVNNVRGVQGYTGLYKGVPVSVMASGMGMPSIGIYSYELYTQYDVENIIRVGSAGALRADLELGSVVAGQGACANSAYLEQYELGGTFAPIADFDLLMAAVESAKELGVKMPVGNLYSSDTFYDAAGREITEDDYQTLDSPYNLYTHQGLPPTAIANAGKASIVAALKPDKTNYYFYVLNPDTQRHVFSRTLTEHNANLRKFG